ncbi:MAG: phosphate ABC transporter, permease protein PstA, partial [Candidatus Onthomorpha sp.]|nr:phosphate ABC transporter, permease protein PstA [Candidatus Onthomorpha sp.]
MKKTKQTIAFWIIRLMSLSILGVLVWILAFILVRGIGAVSWEFLTSMPDDGMTGGGILPAIVGTICLSVGSMIFAFPIGVLSGIYL